MTSHKSGWGAVALAIASWSLITTAAAMTSPPAPPSSELDDLLAEISETGLVPIWVTGEPEPLGWVPVDDISAGGPDAIPIRDVDGRLVGHLLDGTAIAIE